MFWMHFNKNYFQIAPLHCKIALKNINNKDTNKYFHGIQGFIMKNLKYFVLFNEIPLKMMRENYNALIAGGNRWDSIP